MLYWAGREKAIDEKRAKEIFDRMKKKGIQPTATAVNAAINAFAFAGEDKLKKFVLPPREEQQQQEQQQQQQQKQQRKKQQQQQEVATEKSESPKEMQQKESFDIWHLIKNYGVTVTEDIIFNLLKVYATLPDPEGGTSRNGIKGQPSSSPTTASESDSWRKLDRQRLRDLMIRMQGEGLNISSATVANALMRFHGIYSENRVHETMGLYYQVSKHSLQFFLAVFCRASAQTLAECLLWCCCFPPHSR